MDIILCINVARSFVHNVSPFYCDDGYLICENICKLSRIVDHVFFVNDSHESNDPELRYLPPHMMKDDAYGISMIPYVAQKLNNRYTMLHKKTLSAIKDAQNLIMLQKLKPQNIFLTGFITSMDIFSTAVDLMCTDLPFVIKEDCCTDPRRDIHHSSIKQMKWMGITCIS